MTGVIGAAGTFTAGKLTDVLSRRDLRWRSWIVAAGKAGYVPFLAGVFLVDELWLALVLYVVPAFFGGFYLAPTFALIQSLVSLRMRALASSILFFVLNLIGLGLGPLLTGILSDVLTPTFGPAALKYASMMVVFVYLLSAFHFLRASKTIREDLDNAPK